MHKQYNSRSIQSMKIRLLNASNLDVLYRAQVPFSLIPTKPAAGKIFLGLIPYFNAIPHPNSSPSHQSHSSPSSSSESGSNHFNASFMKINIPALSRSVSMSIKNRICNFLCELPHRMAFQIAIHYLFINH